MPRPKQICSVDGCGKPHRGKGLCAMHYWRQKRGFKGRHGSALAFIKEATAYTGTECLMWPYSLTSEGYGSVNYPGMRGTAAHVVCVLAHGAPHRKGLLAAHQCGNRPCVAPSHLRWATQVENMADTISHGTRKRGAKHPMAKLMEADVRAIRAHTHRTQEAMAAEYGVSRTTIEKIRLRQAWSWLED